MAAWLWPTDDLARLGSSRGLELCAMWAGGLWSPGFLAFALQMCVVLLTGFGLARAPIVQRALGRVAGLATSNRRAVVVVAVASAAGCWINWGLGLVGSGLLSSGVPLGNGQATGPVTVARHGEAVDREAATGRVVILPDAALH